MTSARNQPTRAHRTRQARRGIVRFEVHAPATDRPLIRALARRLAGGGPGAARARATLERLLTGEPPPTGGILAALRRSPLVSANLDLSRPRLEARIPDL